MTPIYPAGTSDYSWERDEARAAAQDAAFDYDDRPTRAELASEEDFYYGRTRRDEQDDW